MDTSGFVRSKTHTRCKHSGAFSSSLNLSSVTRGKIARSVCIIRKFARDLRATDKIFSCTNEDMQKKFMLSNVKASNND